MDDVIVEYDLLSLDLEIYADENALHKNGHVKSINVVDEDGDVKNLILTKNHVRTILYVKDFSTLSCADEICVKFSDTFIPYKYEALNPQTFEFENFPLTHTRCMFLSKSKYCNAYGQIVLRVEGNRVDRVDGDTLKNDSTTKDEITMTKISKCIVERVYEITDGNCTILSTDNDNKWKDQKNGGKGAKGFDGLAYAPFARYRHSSNEKTTFKIYLPKQKNTGPFLFGETNLKDVIYHRTGALYTSTADKTSRNENKYNIVFENVSDNKPGLCIFCVYLEGNERVYVAGSDGTTKQSITIYRGDTYEDGNNRLYSFYYYDPYDVCYDDDTNNNVRITCIVDDDSKFYHSPLYRVHLNTENTTRRYGLPFMPMTLIGEQFEVLFHHKRSENQDLIWP